jgi:hypothetical protein
VNAATQDQGRKPITLSLTPLDYTRLEEIRAAIEVISLSEANRYAIRVAHESLVREGRIPTKGKKRRP